MEKRWFLYKGKLYHWVGDHICGGVTKVMLLPEHIEQLHLNHEHLLQVPNTDPELVELTDGNGRLDQLPLPFRGKDYM